MLDQQSLNPRDNVRAIRCTLDEFAALNQQDIDRELHRIAKLEHREDFEFCWRGIRKTLRRGGFEGCLLRKQASLIAKKEAEQTTRIEVRLVCSCFSCSDWRCATRWLRCVFKACRVLSYSDRIDQGGKRSRKRVTVAFNRSTGHSHICAQWVRHTDKRKNVTMEFPVGLQMEHSKNRRSIKTSCGRHKTMLCSRRRVHLNFIAQFRAETEIRDKYSRRGSIDYRTDWISSMSIQRRRPHFCIPW